jgi:hypothetical protein
MTRHRELDDVLREWVDHGSERLPQHNLAAALAQIEITPQRGARTALLEGLLMRFQTVAAPLAIAAAVIAAIVIIAAITRPNVGIPVSTSTPIPTSTLPPPSATLDDYSTSAFATPLTFRLGPPPDPDGWLVTDTATLVRISATEEATSRAYILDPAAIRVVEADGAPSTLPDDLVGWLAGQAGISAEEGRTADDQDPRTYPVAGQETQTLVVRFTDEAVGRTLLQTTEGYALAPMDPEAEWLILPFSSEDGNLLVVITMSGTNFGPSYLDMVGSIEFR